MTAPSKPLIATMIAAACAAVALRLLFIYKFPMLNASDSVIYSELAQNWLHAHVYGMSVNGQLMPVDIRMPGYPAILAAIAAVAGTSHLAVSWIQVLIDLATCCVVALLAGRVAAEKNQGSKMRAMTAAFCLAGICPFIANYTTGILSEVSAAFFTAWALLILGGAVGGGGGGGEGRGGGWRGGWGGGGGLGGGVGRSGWFLGGLVAGLGTLVRPDTPLILVAVSLVVLAGYWPGKQMAAFFRVMVLMWAGLVLPLLPWAIRNWTTLHQVQFLAPRYTQLPGELVPRGVNAWTNTWLWRFRDVYLFSWKLDDEEINLDDIPVHAFDSDQERERVRAVLEE